MKKYVLKSGYWNWLVFACESYSIAATTVILGCCGYFGYSAIFSVPVFGERFQAKAVARNFALVEVGYLICTIVLLCELVAAVLKKEKGKFYCALFFFVLSAISMVLLFPATLVVPT